MFDIVLRTYGRFAPLRPCRKPNLKIVQRKLCNAFIIVAIWSQFCHQVLKFWFYPQIKSAPTITITTRSVGLGKDRTINIGQANLCMLYVDIAPNARLPGKLHLRQIAINNWWRLIDRATRPVHLPLLRISSQLLRSDQNLVMMVMVFLRIMVMSTTNVQSSVCQLGKGANKKIRKSLVFY